MSREVETWAREQKTGNPVRKAVLVALGNQANSMGQDCYPSIRFIAEEVEVDERTVQRRIKELETMGFIRRVRRERPDGSQSSNGFEFIGYVPPRLSHRKAGGDNLSPGGVNLTGTGDAAVTGSGDTAVTPRTPNVLTPPTSDEESSDVVPPGTGIPQGNLDLGEAPKVRKGPHRLPEDWTPPPIDTLPETTQAVVRQWPKGAYEFVATGFAAHWTAESGVKASKRDWRAAWIKWLSTEGARVRHMAKAGIGFEVVQRQDVKPDVEAEALIAMQRLESDDLQSVRALLRHSVGAKTYDGWLRPTALTLNGKFLKLTAPSQFMADWIANHFEQPLLTAAAAVFGWPLHGVEVVAL